MVVTADPVATRLVDSLARPGGNITGITRLTRELSGKRLELLTEMIPRLSRVGILSMVGFTAPKDYEAAARGLKVHLQILEVQGPPPDLPAAFQAAVKGTCRRNYHHQHSRVSRLPKANCRPCRAESAAVNVRECYQVSKPAASPLTIPIAAKFLSAPRFSSTRF